MSKQKFKQITKDEVNFNMVKDYVEVQGHSITEAVKRLCSYKGIEYSDNLRRRFSERLAKKGVTEKTSDKYVPLELSDEYQIAVKRTVPKSKYYLISSCQAESELHKDFFDNMRAFSEYIGAEILLQPSRYRNPSSLEANRRIKEKEKGRTIWAKEAQPYLYASDLKLNNFLSVLMALKIQPTAKLPLSSTNGFTGDSSAIIPHCKQHLESMPVLPDTPHKLLLTTGSVTKPNFTDTKIGYESAWAHEYGFVLAEIVDDEKYFVHQVSADKDGNFYFLDYKVFNGVVSKGAEPYPAIVFGDLHFGETCEIAYQASLEMSRRLKVENVFTHDVGNLHSISHHDLKSPTTMLKKEEEGLTDLQGEIEMILDEMSRLSNYLPMSQIHVVESNHPLWIERWIDSNDWRKSPNKRMYLELAVLVASGKTKGKGVLNYLIEQEVPSVKTYTEDDSLRVKGFEMLLHGHRGNASSRGSVNQFKGLSFKSISAHSHVPRKINGSLSAGTLTKLKPDYVKGLSAWMNSNVVITPNGRASHIHILGGSYTTL